MKQRNTGGADSDGKAGSVATIVIPTQYLFTGRFRCTCTFFTHPSRMSATARGHNLGLLGTGLSRSVWPEAHGRA